MTRELKLKIVDKKLGLGAKPKGDELVLHNNGDKEGRSKSRKRKPRSR
jgi:hypothetical protein